MKKHSFKKSAILLCAGLFLGASVISGCSLVTLNYDKYYSAVAGKISFKDGTEIEITRKDLRVAFNRYGFADQVNSGAYTEAEAYEKTLDYLVSQKLAIKDAEDKSRAQNSDDQVLTNLEKKYLWEKTAEAIRSNVDSYTSASSSSSATETPEGAITRKLYSSSVKLRYDESADAYYLELPESAKKDIQVHNFWSDGNKDIEKEEDKKQIYQILLNYIKDSQVLKDAYQEYLSTIKDSEKNFNLSRDVESMFLREIDRVYGIIYDSFMIDKYNDFISSKTTNNVIIQNMLDLYENKVRADYTKYLDVEDQISDVKDGVRNYYYFNENSNIEWFCVTHILIKFDDVEQGLFDYYTSEIEKIEGDSESASTNKKRYQDQIDQLYSNLVSVNRSEIEGNVWNDEGAQGYNASDLYDYVVTEVGKKNTEFGKIEKFTDLTYQFNEDTGLFSSEYNYVVGVDYSKNSEVYGNCEVYSNWVESFNKAAIALHNHGNGRIGDVYSDENGVGLVKSNYGIHIMMYAGKVDNLFRGINRNFTMQEKDIAILNQTRLNAGIDKTYFDLMYEECVPSTSSIFETLDIERLKSATEKIEYFKDSF